MKLSYSSMEMYKLCSYKYYLHYIKNLRSIYTSSALIFGNAIDLGINRILLEKKKELSEEEIKSLETSEFDIFYKAMETVQINDDIVEVKSSDRVQYYKGDFDLDLLQEEDYLTINEQFSLTTSDIPEFIDNCFYTIKCKEKLSKKDNQIYNNIAWLCLKKKGILLLKAYKDEVMPQIKEVHNIQRSVNLPNEFGDYITGFVDFEATFIDGIKRVVDNKTSSEAYKLNSVETSPQLALYSEYLENRHCSYVVLIKKLRKKEPRVRVQIIFGTITDNLLNSVFEQVGTIEIGIKSNEFKKDFNNCFHFGKPCPYFAFCRDSNKLDGLVLKKETKDEIPKK